MEYYFSVLLLLVDICFNNCLFCRILQNNDADQPGPSSIVPATGGDSAVPGASTNNGSEPSEGQPDADGVVRSYKCEE